MPLYVSAECEDLGCGGVTAAVEHRPGTVVWREFGLQTDYEEYDPSRTLTGLGPFTFDASRYRNVLLDSTGG